MSNDHEVSDSHASLSELRFDHYEVQTREDGQPFELGRGAMGVTYRAVDTVLGHAVALKVIDARIAAHSEARKRFLREARAAARLRHPNVASVFYYGVRKGDGQCFYAMELVEGETLESRLRRAGPLAVDPALEVTTQVARALVAAEAHGLVHRDLKSANLMLVDGPALMVKMIDFGLAKAAEIAGSEADLTHGGFVGTPAFASPEQFTGASVDVRSDLYSLGITLWEMLTGQPPFRGSPTEVMYQHQHAPLPLGQLRGVPLPVVVLIQILLDKDPARRFQNPPKLLKAIPTVLHAIEANQSLIHQDLLVENALLRSHDPASIAAPEKSIAVLPFESLSDNKSDMYFADGVQDEILSNLSRVSQLKVVSRTSVMSYRQGGNRDLRSIAAALGVAHVVEGTVRKHGNRVRITTRLIDARKDEALWCESYDRDLADVFTIQSDIAENVATKLSARLSPEERQGIEEKPTDDMEAYDLYLRAKELTAQVSYFYQRTRDALLDAIALLDRATGRDPNFALAYCEIANSHDYLYNLSDLYSLDEMSDRRLLGDAAVDQAMRLRPDLPETHLAAAFHSYVCYRDYDRAKLHVSIVKRTLPNNTDILELIAIMDRRQGKFEESTTALEKATSLDPRNTNFLFQLSINYGRLRRYDEHDQICDRLSVLEANAPVLIVNKASAGLRGKADLPTYRVALESLPPSIKDDLDVTSMRFHAAVLGRDWKAAEAIISISSHSEFYFFDYFVEGGIVPRGCLEIWLARVQRKRPPTEVGFERGRDELNQKVKMHPEDARLLSALAIIDAALGRKLESIEKARRAVDMLPVSKDAMDGPLLVEALATVYALTDEPDLAFRELDTSAKMPGGISYGYLKLDPRWDPLRADPRFDELLAQLAPRN